VQNLSYENEFDLHENEHVGGTHFHMNGFVRRLVLRQRQKAIRKMAYIVLKLRPRKLSLSGLVLGRLVLSVLAVSI